MKWKKGKIYKFESGKSYIFLRREILTFAKLSIGIDYEEEPISEEYTDSIKVEGSFLYDIADKKEVFRPDDKNLYHTITGDRSNL